MNRVVRAQSPTGSRYRIHRLAAVALSAALVFVGGGQLAAASSLPSGPVASNGNGHIRTTVEWATPVKDDVLDGTVDLAVTGTYLTTVDVYAGNQLVTSLTVDPTGTSASGELDTTAWPDGTVKLTAKATGTQGPPGHRKASASVKVAVGNAGADYALPGYSLIFSDEFEGTELDRSLWCTRYMYDGGVFPEPQVPDEACMGVDPETGALLGTLDTLGGNGQEEQVYRDFNANGEPMHTVQNGYLSLHATVTGPSAQFPYESAMIRTKPEFQPTEGHPIYLTSQVRMPDVQGSWPAFWLAGGYGDGTIRPPWPPEIDILEGALNVQDDRRDMFHMGTITWGSDQDPPPQGTQEWFETGPNFDTQWGNYLAPDGESIRDQWIEVGLEWFTDHVCWYVDGAKVTCQQYTWVTNEGPTNPAAVMLNLAVGGPWAGRYGEDLAGFPMTYDIDHVRIYQQ